MKPVFHLAWAFLKGYKKQTAVLLLGMVLSAALFTGVGSLYANGRAAALDNALAASGDWHYQTRGDMAWMDDFRAVPDGAGYALDDWGVVTVRKVLDAPLTLELVSADTHYLEMMHRSLEEGRWPQAQGDIAMDRHSLKNLGVPQRLGSTVTLDGEDFTLCGIVSELPAQLAEKRNGALELFVSPSYDVGTNGSFLFLRFDGGRNVYKQLQTFEKRFDIDPKAVARNTALDDYLDIEAPANTWQILRDAFKDPAMGLPFAWGQLNSQGQLMTVALLAALACFGAFILYSLFQISVVKRTAYYAMMQTCGLGNGGVAALLLAELAMVFAVGYPLGAALGSGAAALIYSVSGQTFVPRSQARHKGASPDMQNLDVSALPDAGAFHVSGQILLAGAVFFALMLVFIAWRLAAQMKKQNLRQLMNQDKAVSTRWRKLASRGRHALTTVLTHRFMTTRRGFLAGLLLSLSVGSVLFLSAAYVSQNAEVNNNLTFKADDGLGSDMVLDETSAALSDVISEETVADIKQLDGLAAVQPVRYLLGELDLPSGRFHWPEYYAETANEPDFEPDPVIMENYGGMIVQTGADSYRLKVNIYGYDDAMLLALNDYLLEGTIDPDAMRRDNSVILKTLVDGQGHYDGITYAPGERLSLKTPAADAPAEDLRFESADSVYAINDFQIAAVVSRPLAKVDNFIGDNSESEVDIIMTNEQMAKNFGVTGYRTVSLTLAEGADVQTVGEAAKAAASDQPNLLLTDYTTRIAAQNAYLHQQMLFFYGIAVVLLLASVLHLTNSMSHLINERRREFAILRAMGLSDRGFYRMLAAEGLRVGFYAGAVTLAVYLLAQRVLYYFLQHVYLYLHPSAMINGWLLLGVVALNILLCLVTVLLAGRHAVKDALSQTLHE